MKHTTKLLSLILALTMLFSLLALPSYADGEEPADTSLAAPALEAEDTVPAPTETPLDDPEAYGGEVRSFSYIYFSPELSLSTDSAPQDDLLFAAAPMDEAYSSVDAGVISAVKNQGSYPTCWAFSATSSAEASIASSEQSSDQLDLSELQTVYYIYGQLKNDPLGNSTGDGIKLSCNYWEMGGNNLWTMWSLLGWSNGAEESVMPYSDIQKKFSEEYNYAYDLFHLQDVRIIPLKGEFDEDGVLVSFDYAEDIKQAVIDYGGVDVSYIHSNTFYDSEEDLADNVNPHVGYSTEYKSHYTATEYCGSGGGGHAVTIVGWNDNYPKEYFGVEAPGDGAWLVKNSWGENWGTDGDTDFEDYADDPSAGFFWLSYYDYGLNTYSEVGLVYDYDTAGTYDNNYMYDGGCYPVNVNPDGDEYDHAFSAGATYRISASDNELIEAVGFGTLTEDVDYSVQLYKLSEGAGLDADPTVCGTPLLEKPVTGCTDYSGFYTVELPTAVKVSKGDIVSVVVSMESANELGICADVSKELDGIFSFIANTENDHTFLLHGGEYESLGGQGYTARIKMYTSNEVTPASVKLSTSSVSLYVGKTAQLKPIMTNCEGYTAEWTSDREDVATVSDNGLITAVSAGIANVTLTLTKEDAEPVSAVCAVTVRSLTTKLEASDPNVRFPNTGTYALLDLDIDEGSTVSLTVPVGEYYSSADPAYDYCYVYSGIIVRIKGNSLKFNVYTAEAELCVGKTVAILIVDKLSGLRTTVNVTVPGVESITVDTATLGLAAGESKTVNVVMSPIVKYFRFACESSDDLVSLDYKYYYSDYKADTMTIPVTVTAGSSSAAVTNIALSFADPLTGASAESAAVVGGARNMEMSPASLDLKVAKSALLTAKVNGSVKALTLWSSSDTSVATVVNGLVVGVNPGVCVITAKYLTSRVCTCVVTVTEQGDDITVTPTAVLREGEKLTLSAETAAKNYPLTWSSDNEAVAAVSSLGVVTAKSAGTANITVKNRAGETAVCTVTVTEKTKLTDVTFTASSVKAKLLIVKSIKDTVKPVFSDGEAHSGEYTVSYKSSNTRIATVSSLGTVLGLKKGSAVITVTVTYNGVSKSADLPVNVVSAFS